MFRDAFTIYNALKRSRKTILTELLPVYTRPGQDGPDQLDELGTVTLNIGPHVFYNTKLYMAVAASTNHVKRKKSGVATGSSVPNITPELIQQLNKASASDSDLAKTLRKAAAGTANQQELAKLARTIDAIQKESGAKAGLAKASTSTATQAAISTTKSASSSLPLPLIVVEFAEQPDMRFFVPPHCRSTPLPSSEERAGACSTSHGDMLLLSCAVVPEASQNKEMVDPMNEAGVALPVDIIIAGCTKEITRALQSCSASGKPDDAAASWWTQSVSLGTGTGRARPLNSAAQITSAPDPFSFVHPPPSNVPEEERVLPLTKAEVSFPTFSTATGQFKAGKVGGGIAKKKRDLELAAQAAAKAKASSSRRNRPNSRSVRRECLRPMALVYCSPLSTQLLQARYGQATQMNPTRPAHLARHLLRRCRWRRCPRLQPSRDRNVPPPPA